MTDSRFGVGSEIVSTNVTDSKNTTDDGSKVKGSEEDSSKSEVNRGSDESEDSTKDEAIRNSSRKKEGFHGEDCDPSNMCTDEEDQFVACLRVPGNGESLLNESLYCVYKSFSFWFSGLSFVSSFLCADAPHLSLLIQNKGTSALLVTITAPGFVRLDKNKVQLLENQDTKVISIC